MGELSSRQKRQKGGRFLPEAAPTPKEGGAKKQGDFLFLTEDGRRKKGVGQVSYPINAFGSST